MNTISCIVIDDEPLAVQLMESYVRKTPFLELKGSFTNGKEAFAFLQDNPVELMFCDIQMPDLSGIDLSKMIPEETKVIFTTAFSQYAIEGFKVHALDYLLKPISYDDFLASAKHALKTLTPDISGQPSGPGRVHPRSAAAEYGLSPEAAPERSEESGLPEPALDALAHVSISVTNEGPYDGTEVVQLYVRDEYASVTRPVKELKAFKRVFLKVGESAEVTFAITPEMLQCFGADNRWSVEPGEFTILIGSSSADQDLQKLSLTID